MLRDMSDQELKEIIRALARGADILLADERIAVMLPQFKQQLEWLATLQSFRLPLEAEPSIVFQHRRRAPRTRRTR